MQTTHRGEIDGLRAIAIITVLLFHFYPSTFPNGYLGVDVFFVISGYLITTGLSRDVTAGSFRFHRFYHRRIRRILPAVLVMLGATWIAGYTMLLAPDFVKFSHSLVASLGLSANIYFFLTGGYFGHNDELKPLLHMWSLGVEEQFYLVFPLVIFALVKYVRNTKYQLATIILLAVGSYAAGVFLSTIGGDNASFFLIPMRAWQFATGAIFALLPAVTAQLRRNGVIVLVGLALLAANFYHPPTRIPKATLMTVGVGLLLWVQWEPDAVLTRLLTFGALRFIGLISFSLYLWHWPVISFLRYLSVEPPTAWMATAGLVSSLAIGYLSWRFVEEPFRKGLSSKQVYIFVVSMYLVLAAVVVMTVKNLGFPGRHGSDANAIAMSVDSNFRCPKESSFLYGGSKACLIGKAKAEGYTVALLGNSHAQMYAPVFAEAIDRLGQRGIVIPLNSCLPTIDINISLACLRSARLNFKAVIKDTNINTVVIGTTWTQKSLVDADGQALTVTEGLFADAVSKLVRSLDENGKTTYLIGPVATPGTNFASILSREIAFGDASRVIPTSPRASFDSKYAASITRFEKELGARFLRPHEQLCNMEQCFFAADGVSYFADGTHLSHDGASQAATAFGALSAGR